MHSPKPIGVIAQTSKASFCLPQRAAQVHGGFTGFCASMLNYSRAVKPIGVHSAKPRGVIAQSKTHRCDCTDKQG